MILTVILSLILWFIGSALLSFALLGIPAWLSTLSGNMEQIIYRLLSSKFVDHIIPVICRGLPMLLTSWVTAKIHSDSSKWYIVSSIVTIAIIIVSQIYGLINGESNTLWLIEGVIAMIASIAVVKSEYY